MLLSGIAIPSSNPSDFFFFQSFLFFLSFPLLSLVLPKHLKYILYLLLFCLEIVKTKIPQLTLTFSTKFLQFHAFILTNFTLLFLQLSRIFPQNFLLGSHKKDSCRIFEVAPFSCGTSQMSCIIYVYINVFSEMQISKT